MNEKKLVELREKVERCKKCELWKTRTRVVFGDGWSSAKVMLVGEAPGRNEDIRGKPFVGPAGKFLDELLRLAGLKRETIYITNILKCRPPKNRAPRVGEIYACTPYLDEQIKYIRPKVICTLGNFATSYILKKFGFNPQPIGRIHGNVFEVESAPFRLRIIPSYHPATALYKPYMKEVLRRDWTSLKIKLSS